MKTRSCAKKGLTETPDHGCIPMFNAMTSFQRCAFNQTGGDETVVSIVVAILSHEKSQQHDPILVWA